jgi:hypothetical protein
MSELDKMMRKFQATLSDEPELDLG